MASITYNNQWDRDKILQKIDKLSPREPIKFDNSGIIQGDNFRTMCRLLPEYRGKVDLVYIDPPYNTGRDFVFSQGKVSHVSSPDGEIAYSDNKNFDSFLEFIRIRLYLIHELLSDCGTLYLHIDCKVGHYIKVLLDEVFGMDNFVNDITRIKCSPKNFSRKAYGNVKDVVYIYSKKQGQNIWNEVKEKMTDEELKKNFTKLEKETGRYYTTMSCSAPGETQNGETGGEWKGVYPPKGRHWAYTLDKLNELDDKGLIEWSANRVPRIKYYADENKGKKIQDVWLNWKDHPHPKYPTEKNSDMLEMIVLQSSNPNSLVMDCFAGSGSFLAVGVKHRRRVIGIDESETAISVMTAREELRDIPIIKSL